MYIFRCFIVYQDTNYNIYYNDYSIVIFAGIMVNRNYFKHVVSIRFLLWRNWNQRLSILQIRLRKKSHLPKLILNLKLQLQLQFSLYRATRKKKCLLHLSHSPEHRLFLHRCHLQSAPIMSSKRNILTTDEAQSRCVRPPPLPVKCVATIPTACCQRTP